MTIPTSPETWLTVAEAAAVMRITPRKVLNRIEKGTLTYRRADDIPGTESGEVNYLIRLEALSHAAQWRYQLDRLPAEEQFSLDLATPRAFYGDRWLTQYLDMSRLLQEAAAIRQNYRGTGQVTRKMSELAASHGISPATLYRFCGRPSAREASRLYLDPVYLAAHLPQSMCLMSVDLAYMLYLCKDRRYTQNDIFREMAKHREFACDDCPYYAEPSEGEVRCTRASGRILLPNNRRTINRLLARVPEEMICYQRKGISEWRARYGYFAVRERPVLVNENWQGDHHKLDLFVRVKIRTGCADHRYNKEIAIRPTLTAWMDTATGCVVGWVISVRPNADTIAEAFCRGVALTQGEEFHGLPKSIYVDNGKDYRSALLEDVPDDWKAEAERESGFLNKRFAGNGLLSSLGIEIYHALPYHPQTKSIERLFGTLESGWISKLPGWCGSSVEERPANFPALLDDLLKSGKLMTLEAFARYFQEVILPEYHHRKEDPENYGEGCRIDSGEGWVPEIDDMSPMERYRAFAKPYLITPGWQTLCILKANCKKGCSIRGQGIRFRNVIYIADEMTAHIGRKADIYYHDVEKPLSPASITVVVDGRFVCEAYPAKKLPYYGAEPFELQELSDTKQRQESAVRGAIARIERSTKGILPEKYSDAMFAPPDEKAQLRDEAYGARVVEESQEEGGPVSGERPGAAISRERNASSAALAAEEYKQSRGDYARGMKLLF